MTLRDTLQQQLEQLKFGHTQILVALGMSSIPESQLMPLIQETLVSNVNRLQTTLSEADANNQLLSDVTQCVEAYRDGGTRALLASLQELRSKNRLLIRHDVNPINSLVLCLGLRNSLLSN